MTLATPNGQPCPPEGASAPNSAGSAGISSRPTVDPVGFFSVTYPWPAKILSPNGRGGYRHKSIVTKNTRKKSAEITHNAGLDPVNVANVSEVIFHPRSDAQDKDNAVASCKALFDGIADAMGVDDVTFDPKYTMATPVKDGAVVVVFEIPAD